MMNVVRLRNFYKEKVAPVFQDKMGIKNIMEVPYIQKMVLNMGVGKSLKDKKYMEFAFQSLMSVSGQKPIITHARKSIAGFKIRGGWPIGIKVTLRGDRMYEFLDRLISIAIPRIRDFRGFSIKSFDGRGNYNLVINDHTAFPEVSYDKGDNIFGFNIAIITTANNDKQGKMLLDLFNFPFK